MNITEAKILLQHLTERKAQLEDEIKDIENQMLSLKIAIADMVLGLEPEDHNDDEEEEEDGKVPMVQIQFTRDGPIYDYLWKDEREPEDFVWVHKFNSVELQSVKCLGLTMKVPNPSLNYKEAYYD